MVGGQAGDGLGEKPMSGQPPREKTTDQHGFALVELLIVANDNDRGDSDGDADDDDVDDDDCRDHDGDSAEAGHPAFDDGFDEWHTPPWDA